MERYKKCFTYVTNKFKDVSTDKWHNFQFSISIFILGPINSSSNHNTDCDCLYLCPHFSGFVQQELHQETEGAPWGQHRETDECDRHAGGDGQEHASPGIGGKNQIMSIW